MQEKKGRRLPLQFGASVAAAGGSCFVLQPHFQPRIIIKGKRLDGRPGDNKLRGRCGKNAPEETRWWHLNKSPDKWKEKECRRMIKGKRTTAGFFFVCVRNKRDASPMWAVDQTGTTDTDWLGGKTQNTNNTRPSVWAGATAFWRSHVLHIHLKKCHRGL